MKHVVRGTAEGLAEAADTINKAIGWRRYQLDEEEPGLVDWLDTVEHSHRPAIPILTSPGLWIEGAEYSVKNVNDGMWRVTTPSAVHVFTDSQVPAALQLYAEALRAVGEQTDSHSTIVEAEDATLLSDWLKLDYS